MAKQKSSKKTPNKKVDNEIVGKLIDGYSSEEEIEAASKISDKYDRRIPFVNLFQIDINRIICLHLIHYVNRT